MGLFKVVLTSLGSISVLFLLTKIMGNREMAQLSMFDYINSITIGSIAAEMATSLEDNFMEPLLAMIVYAGIIILLALLSQKSIKVRRFIAGKTLILIDNGVIYDANFKKAKIDINEFLTECKIMGYFNLSDIQTALLEPNGKISILPLSTIRPVNPKDLGLVPEQKKVVANVIIDGNTIFENLESTGNNLDWLRKKLKEQNIEKISDVFLATCDEKNNLSVYLKSKNGNTHDVFV